MKRTIQIEVSEQTAVYLVCTKNGTIKGYYFAGDMKLNLEQLKKAKGCEPI